MMTRRGFPPAATAGEATGMDWLEQNAWAAWLGVALMAGGVVLIALR